MKSLQFRKERLTRWVFSRLQKTRRRCRRDVQFLVSVSRSLGALTEAFRAAGNSSSSDRADEPQDPAATTTMSSASDSAATEAPVDEEMCEVCMVAPRDGFALVPCGHTRFCEGCAVRVAKPRTYVY